MRCLIISLLALSFLIAVIGSVVQILEETERRKEDYE